HTTAALRGATTGLGGREATRAHGTAVSTDFFSVFQVQPALGRAFATDEFRWGANVAIVSYGFWRDQLGGNPDLAALRVDVYGRPRQVVGEIPPAFRYPDETANWGPLPPAEDGRRAPNSRA